MFGIPPHVFLAFRPGLTLWIGGSTIIEDMTVRGPGKAPTEAHIVVRITAAGKVFSLLWHDAAENPAATGRTAISFERGKIFDQLAISNSKAVNLPHDIFDDGFLERAFAAIIPGEMLDRFVTLLRTVLIHLFQT